MNTEAMLNPAVWKSNPDDSILQPLQFDVFRPGVLLLKAQARRSETRENIVLVLLNSCFQVRMLSFNLKSVEDMQTAKRMLAWCISAFFWRGTTGAVQSRNYSPIRCCSLTDSQRDDEMEQQYSMPLL